jgi:hypothetical protein
MQKPADIYQFARPKLKLSLFPKTCPTHEISALLEQFNFYKGLFFQDFCVLPQVCPCCLKYRVLEETLFMQSLIHYLLQASVPVVKPQTATVLSVTLFLHSMQK